MPTIASGFKLSNGVTMPCIGLGTWQVPDDDVLVKAIHSAVNLGYRHIDTAHIYGNERSVGVAVRTCGVPRSKLFVTSKLWNTDRGYKETLEAFERTMDALQIGYLDLFLMHWPAARGEAMTWQSINSGTWRAMEEIYRRGRVRAIGVSNFLVHHLVPLLARAEVVPMVNQIEFHPGYMQKATFDFCRSHGIQVEAWSPLGRGALQHVFQPGDGDAMADVAVREHRDHAARGDMIGRELQRPVRDRGNDAAVAVQISDAAMRGQ